MAQERLVKITLLKRYDSEDGVVRISGGQINYLDSIATHISINPADPAFQQPFNKDENVMVYGRREGPLEEIDLHQPIIYDISMDDGKESTLIPIGTAKLAFGDWDLKPGMKSPVNPRVTYETERLRVAFKWGGYQLFPFVKMTPQQGAAPDTRKIGPPNIPHVRIEEVDQRGNVVGEKIEPWKFYKWEQLVDKNAAAEAASRLRQQGYGAQNGDYGPPAAAPALDIAAMVEAEVAKRLGKKAAAGA